MKKWDKVRNWYQKIKFQRLLTLSMVCMVCTIFLMLSLLVTWLSEQRIRQNVKNNMSIVVEQFDVYLGNYMASIYSGFKSLESDQSMVNLQIGAQNERYLSYTATNYIYVKKLLTQFLNANSTSVYSVYINFNDGKVATQAYEKDLLKINYSYETWRQIFPENQYYWVDAGYCRDLIPDQEVGAILFHLYEDVNTGRNGIILIAIKWEFLEKIMNVAALDKDAGLSLITDYGIMHFGNEMAAEKTADIRDYLVSRAEEEKGIQSEILDGYYFMYKNMDITNWKLVYTVKETSISNAHYIMREVMIITGLVIAATAMLISLLSKAVSFPLRELTKKVEDREVLEHEISVHSYAEINSLSSSLEKMRRRINHLLWQIQQEQEEKRQAEIALMQEQINPHFVYNTLYSIMQLCEMKQTEKASKMLAAMSTFYRIGLNEGKQIITVKEELNHVKNYLFIQHFRYPDLFDYTIDCEPEILNCRIPKMSLQPLVENAIYHGIKKKHEFGNICILGGTYDGENAYLEVHDDGPGFSEEKLQAIRFYLKEEGVERAVRQAGSKKQEKDISSEKISFGMKNVDSRIKFEFGKDSGIEIYSSSEDTCVRICFKMKEMEMSDKG